MNYQKIYDSICQKAISENREKGLGIYYEKHHIIPKCLGGNNNKDNLVLLTAKEHYICHRLLIEIYPESNLLKIAFWAMCYKSNKNHKREFIPSSKSIEYAKLKMIEGIKDRPSGRLGKSPWNKGLILEDKKYKVGGKKNKGRKYNKEVNKKKGIKNNQNGAKKIIDINNNIVYDSITIAASKLNTTRHEIYKLLKSNKFSYE